VYNRKRREEFKETNGGVIMKRQSILVLAVVVLFIISSSHASLLVSDSGLPIDYVYAQGHSGYGHDGWVNMTNTLDAAMSNNVDVTSNFENLNQLLGYDALWLDRRGSQTYPSTTVFLTSTEINNIQTFIATGRRVVMIGENDAWTDWNNQILGIVGGSYSHQYDGAAFKAIDHELTDRVEHVRLAAAGVGSGSGTALFDINFATLWGDNALTILDSGFMNDEQWNTAFNGQFATNIAYWVANTGVPFANAGGPYFLDIGDPPIMLGGSVVGDYSQAAWDLNLDGLFDDAFDLQPLISSTMLTSWGFSPGMTWDIGLQVTGLYGGVDTSMTQLTFTPVPGAVFLGSLGLTFSGWMLHRKKRCNEEVS
jgi:hypothetical protein